MADNDYTIIIHYCIQKLREKSTFLKCIVRFFLYCVFLSLQLHIAFVMGNLAFFKYIINIIDHVSSYHITFRSLHFDQSHSYQALFHRTLEQRSLETVI